jgi:hypothetical protein
MSTFVFRSPQSEVRVTVIAADHARATQELVQRLEHLEQMGIVISPEDFELVSAY